MMSLAAIRDLSDEAARKAAARDLVPYKPFDEAEIASYPPFPFPNLGSHRPEGWTLVDSFMADSSGLGRPDEPALTVQQLKERLIRELPKHYGYAIIEEGQFQVVVGVFEAS